MTKRGKIKLNLDKLENVMTYTIIFSAILIMIGVLISIVNKSIAFWITSFGSIIIFFSIFGLVIVIFLKEFRKDNKQNK
ncbi:MAG: hypothetical protein QXP52_00975 [Candidatus Aenigmatarchaeota archaeon]